MVYRVAVIFHFSRKIVSVLVTALTSEIVSVIVIQAMSSSPEYRMGTIHSSSNHRTNSFRRSSISSDWINMRAKQTCALDLLLLVPNIDLRMSRSEPFDAERPSILVRTKGRGSCSADVYWRKTTYLGLTTGQHSLPNDVRKVFHVRICVSSSIRALTISLENLIGWNYTSVSRSLLLS